MKIFVLPLSHDEVVYGKGSLLGKNGRRRLAKVRQPARALTATCTPSRPKNCCSWAASSASGANGPTTPVSIGICSTIRPTRGVQRWVGDLNRFYRSEPALYELDCEPAGFEWIDCGDADSSVVSLMRQGKSTATLVLAVCNFTPVPRENYRIGAPRGGFWREALNSDATDYGGSGVGNRGGVGRRSVAACTAAPVR